MPLNLYTHSLRPFLRKMEFYLPRNTYCTISRAPGDEENAVHTSFCYVSLERKNIMPSVCNLHEVVQLVCNRTMGHLVSENFQNSFFHYIFFLQRVLDARVSSTKE